MKTQSTDSVIERFKKVVTILKEEEDLLVHSIFVSNNDNDYTHLFSDEVRLHNLRSVSKIVVALCFGKIIFEEKIKINGINLNLNTKIGTIINRKIDCDSIYFNKFQDVTLKHLFTHTTGYNKELLFSDNIKSIPENRYLQLLIEEPLIFKSGKHFVYSNASAYLLSVIFQEIVGQKISDFASQFLFSKIGISTYTWNDYGIYCAGATGLSLFNSDLQKIGKLLLNKGVWNHEQIISKEWIEIITSPHFHNFEKYYKEDPLGRNSYGLFTWICNNGDYFVNGNGGQYLIVSPRNKLVVSTVAETSNTEKLAKYLKLIID